MTLGILMFSPLQRLDNSLILNLFLTYSYIFLTYMNNFTFDSVNAFQNPLDSDMERNDYNRRRAQALCATFLYDVDPGSKQLVDANPDVRAYAHPTMRTNENMHIIGRELALVADTPYADMPMELARRAVERVTDESRRERLREALALIGRDANDTADSYYGFYAQVQRDTVRGEFARLQQEQRERQESLTRMDSYVRGDRPSEDGSTYTMQDIANVRAVMDTETMDNALAVRDFMMRHVRQMDEEQDAELIMRTLDGLEGRLFDVIGDNPQRAEMVYGALMHWAEQLKQSDRVGIDDEFVVAVGKKLSNWSNPQVRAALSITGAVGPAGAINPGQLSSTASSLQQAAAESEERRVARSILRAAINKSLEVGEDEHWLPATLRSVAQMGGSTAAYMVPVVGQYFGTADALVGGIETADQHQLAGLTGEQAVGQSLIETGVGAAVELMPWGRVGGRGLSGFLRHTVGEAVQDRTVGRLSRWAVRATQSSTGRAMAAEIGANFVDEALLEPIASGIATYGAEQTFDMFGWSHGRSREFLDSFDELTEIWGDPKQIAALMLFSAGLAGAGAYGINQNVKYWAENRKFWEASGLTPEQVDRVMASDNIAAEGKRMVDEGWLTDPAGMRERRREACQGMADRGEVLVLTGEGALDSELEDSELQEAYRAVWQEFVNRGILPSVQAVGGNRFRIIQTTADGKPSVDITLDARQADAYLQHAIDEADSAETEELQKRTGKKQYVDLREEIGSAMNVIAGNAAMRSVEAKSEQTGIQVDDITRGLPDFIAQPIKAKGYVTLADAQNITEWAIGRINGLIEGGTPEHEAKATKASNHGMARTLGDWSTFARDFAHRERMAGFKRGEGSISVSRTRNRKKVMFNGREVLGQTMMTVPGHVRMNGAVEDVTESFVDMMIQERAAVLLGDKEATMQERADAEADALNEMAGIVREAREAVQQIDPSADIEEVKDGDKMSVIEALSTMATSNFLASAVTPKWMRSLQAALRGNLETADALHKVRSAYAAALQQNPEQVGQMDEMLSKLGVYVQDVFREARIEAVDVQAWKAAQAIAGARADGPSGSGGAPVSAVKQVAEENEAEIVRNERQEEPEPEVKVSPTQEAEEAREVLQQMAPAGNAPADMKGVFVDDQCYYNQAGGFWCGMIRKSDLRDGTEQVKIGQKGKHGVIAGKELTGRFQHSVGAIYVWRRKNGELQVISGRHRFAKLMEDEQAEYCNAYVFNEDEAHDERWARMLDYENNMRDDQADELTAATYVRETGLTDAELKDRGLMRNGTRCKRGALIGRFARQELWTRFKNGVIEPKDAEIVCNLTRNISRQERIEEIQTRCCMLLEAKKSWEFIGGMVQLMANKEMVTMKQGLLDFGADFEADLARAAEWIERNIKAINESITLLKQGKKLSGKKRAEAERLGITTATQEGAEEMLRDLEMLKGQFELIGSYPDLVAQAQMWDGKTEVDPVGRYLEQAREEREQAAAEGEMDADEYLAEQARKEAAEAVPTLFSMEMEQAVKSEMALIKAAAEKDGTFMKAPNGKPTNLTELQWLQVRTKAFTDWFGDWESAAYMQYFRNRLLGLLAPDVVQKFAGKEYEEIKKSDLDKRVLPMAYIPLNIAKLMGEYVTDNLIYTSDFRFVEHVLNHHPEIKDYERYVDDLLNAFSNPEKIYLDTKTNSFLFLKNEQTYFLSIANPPGEGQRYIQWKTAYHSHKLQGSRYKEIWNKNNREPVGADLHDKGPTRNEFPSARLSDLGSKRSIKEVVRDVKPENVSKVVDENGEPRVVYHGTVHGGFRVFDVDGRGKTEGTGAFFTSDKRVAEGYSANFHTGGVNPEVYACFLNIREPYEVDFEGNSWNRVPDRASGYFVHYDNGESEWFSNRADADFAVSGYDGKAKIEEDWEESPTLDDLAREVWEEEPNKDGIIAKNVVDSAVGANKSYPATDFIVVSPNQIKSATDNRGTFDGGSSDITFNVVGPSAKNWDKIKHRAFNGRDDGKERVELDSSKAKMKKAPLHRMDDSLVRDIEARLKLFREQLEQHGRWGAVLADWSKGIYKVDTWDEQNYMRQMLRGAGLEFPTLARMGELGVFALGLDGSVASAKKILKAGVMKNVVGYNRLGEVLDFPALFESYPELKKLPVWWMNDNFRMRGAYVISNRGGMNRIMVRANRSEGGKLSTLLHEVQHWIQHKEGFAYGSAPGGAVEFLRRMGNPEADSPKGKQYRRFAGEIESRNVQARRWLAEAEREELPFNETLEYPGEAISYTVEDMMTFNVIGPSAANWDKIKHRAFKGRDDGKLRAEIDASRAKLKSEALRGKNLKAYRQIIADWDELPEAERKEVEAYAELCAERDEAANKLKETTDNDFQEAYAAANKLADEVNSKRVKVREIIGEFFKMKGADGSVGITAKNEIIDAMAMDFWCEWGSDKVENSLASDPMATGMALFDVLDYPELYEAYPQLENLSVFTEDLKGYYGLAGHNSWSDYIMMNRSLLDNGEQFLSTLLHEVQHVIQRIEGFAKGGNKESVRRKVKELLEGTGARIDMLERDLRWFSAVDIARDLLKEARRLRRYPNAWKRSGRRFEFARMSDSAEEIRENILRDIAERYKEFRRDDTSETLLLDMPDLLLPEVHFHSVDSIEAGLAALDKLKSRKLVFRGTAAKKNRRLKELQKRHDAMQKVLSEFEYEPYELYLRLAGEIEARNVQQRVRMTADERLATPFNDTLEYPGEALVTYNMERVQANWEATLKRFLAMPPVAGTPAYERDINVCPTPAVMQMVGARGLDLVISPHVLVKCLDEDIVLGNGKTIREMYGAEDEDQGKHKILLSDLQKLTYALANPICIAVSEKSRSIEIVTELKEGDRNILVAVRLDTIRTGQRHQRVNRINSLYGKNKIEKILSHQMLYWDNEKARRWTGDRGLQLPTVPYPERAYGESVYTPYDLVKYKMQTGLSFSMERASMRALDVLRGRSDERAGETLIKDWQRACEAWGQLAGTGEGYLGKGAKTLGEMQALIGATKGVLPEKYCRMGHLNGLMRWAGIYARMQQNGELPRAGVINGPIYQKFVERLQKGDELNRVQGMSEEEAKEALASLAGERLEVAMLKVANECRRRLELFLKDREKERIDWIVEKAYPNRQAGKAWPRGKMAAEAYRRMELAYKFMRMQPDDLAEFIKGIKNQLNELEPSDEEYEAKEAKLEDELFLAQTFGAWDNMSFVQARRASGAMAEMVLAGRNEWQSKLREERRRAEFVRRQIASHFKTSTKDMIGKRTGDAAKEKADKLTIGQAIARGGMSYSQLMLALEGKLGKEFTSRHIRMIAKAHQEIQRFNQERQRWMFKTLAKITGLKTEGEIEEWINGNNENFDTGIVLTPTNVTQCVLTPDEAEMWLAMTAEEREEHRRQLQEAARSKGQEPDNIPDEAQMEELRQKLEASEKNGTTPREYVLRREHRIKQPLRCTKEALLYAILTFEQDDYKRLMDVNGISEEQLARMRELVGPKLLAWGYAMREKLNEHGQHMAELYEAYTGVPFASRQNYFRGVFDTAIAKDNGEAIDVQNAITGGKYGVLVPRQYHNLKLNWNTSATQVGLSTLNQQQNYISTAHITREWRTLLANPVFEKRMRAEIGDAAANMIQSWTKLIDGAVITDAKTQSAFKNFLGKILGFYAISRLAGNVYTFVKQASALLNGLVGGRVPTSIIEGNAIKQQLVYRHIGLGEYLKYLCAAMAGRTEITWQEVEQADYIAGRMSVEGHNLEQASMLAPGQKVPSKLGRAGRTVSEKSMDAIGWADRKSNTVAALAIAEAVYQQAKAENKDGMVPDAELRRVAIETAGLMIELAAQPQLRTQKNYWAASGALGVFGDFFFMFKSEALGKMGVYIAQMFNGNHKAWLAGWLSFGVANALLLALIDYMRGYGPDDDDDDFWTRQLGSIALNTVFQDVSSLPVLGDVPAYLKSQILGEREWKSSLVDMVLPIRDIWSAGQREVKNIQRGRELEAHVTALCSLARAVGAGGGWVANSSRVPIGTCAELALAAAAISNVVRFGKDVVKFLTED